MKEIKKRLYGIYILVVAVFILLLHFLLSNIVEDRIIEQQRLSLNKEIISLVDYLEDANQEEGLTQENVIQSLDEVAAIVNERITFIDLDGNPLYDSVASLDELTNLIELTEIQQVLYGEDIGVSRRENSMTSSDQYLIARALLDETGQAIGIMRLSNDVTNITSVTDLVLLSQFAGMAVLAAVLMYLTGHWLNNINKSIANMNNVVTELTEENYEARYKLDSFEDLDNLGGSVNELADNLASQRLQLITSEERTIGLMNQLIIGVMLLDEERRIQMVNPAMNELLGINLYGKITQLFTDYITSAELIELIEEAYRIDDSVNAEIKIYFPEEKRLDVNIVPVPGSETEETNYIVLLYDITEIRRLEKVRTDFAANVSHELRTPITALKGFSETLLDGAMHDEEVLKEFLEIMLNESSRLDSMVKDILHLSKLEQGHERFSHEWIEVSSVVDEVFQILQQKMVIKDIQCYMEETEKVTIRANRNHLKQILMNLIANAISYTPEKGTVIVDINQIGDEAKIQVIDNGIGIPESDQARIFERFYRVDKARSRNAGGTGLGLSIVKWVIESMNGRIELFSEAEIGTTFVVWLPLDNKPYLENE